MIYLNVIKAMSGEQMMVRITKDNWLILTNFIERLADRSHVVITPIRSAGKLLLWVSPTNRPYDGVTYPIHYKDGQYPAVKITYLVNEYFLKPKRYMAVWDEYEDKIKIIIYE